MKLKAEIGGQQFAVELPGHDISIPLLFDGPQPNTYGVAAATSRAYRNGGWVGDVRAGGSCNFETTTLTPHCNGTHTECIGHITAERHSLADRLRQAHFPATLLSVIPNSGATTRDSYDPPLAPTDLVIDRACLEAALGALPKLTPEFHAAFVIRTLPNGYDKLARDYMQHPPAFFSLEAMRFLVGLGMTHLLTDLPSVDRLFDEGRLNAHHIFWNIPEGSNTPVPESRPDSTITELIFVPDILSDGHYLLNLQTAPFSSDASPSRPFLHPLQSL
jgi:arylformamidase